MNALEQKEKKQQQQQHIECEEITTNKSTFTHTPQAQKVKITIRNDNVAMSKQLIG